MSFQEGLTYVGKHRVLGDSLQHTIRISKVSSTHTHASIQASSNELMYKGQQVVFSHESEWAIKYNWSIAGSNEPTVIGKYELEFMIELALATHDKEWFSQLTKQLEEVK